MNNTDYHQNIADRAVQASLDKTQVEKIAQVYSRRWSKAARVDIQTNRSYGADLARSCRTVDLPVVFTEFAAWQVRQEEAKQKAAETAQRAQEEAAQANAQRASEAAERTRAESIAAPSLQPTVDRVQTMAPAGVAQVDFAAEATKASRILGCTPQDLKMAGAEDSNVLYDVVCSGGTSSLRLACDRTGLCLKK